MNSISRDVVISLCTRSKQPRPRMSEQLTDYVVQWTCGLTDICLARNMQIDSAIRVADHMGAKKIVMLDDDMMISERAIMTLVRECRRGQAVSARYSPRGEPDMLVSAQLDGTRVSGLGAACVHVDDLRSLCEKSVTFYNGRKLKACTWSGPSSDGWLSDDYRFWLRLAREVGVELRILRVDVGHFDVDSLETTWPAHNAQELELSLLLTPPAETIDT